MIQKLKADTIRRAAARLLLLIALAALFWFLGGRSTLELIKGSVNLADIPMEEMNGRYVTLEVRNTLGEYVYTEERDAGQPAGSGEVQSAEFMVITPDENHVMGILVNRRDLDKYDPLFYAQIDSEEWDPAPEDYFTVTGWVSAMESDSVPYFDEILDELGFSRSVAVYSVLEVNRVNGVTVWGAWLLGAAALFVVALGVVCVVRACTGSYQRPIEDYIDGSPNPESLREELDLWFPEADKFGKSVFFGPRYIVFHSGLKSVLAPAEDLLWVYKQITRTNFIRTATNLILQTSDKKQNAIPIRHKEADRALHFLTEQYPWVVVGFESDFRKLYKKSDLEGLRQIAQWQRGQGPETGALEYSPESAVFGEASGQNPSTDL